MWKWKIYQLSVFFFVLWRLHVESDVFPPNPIARFVVAGMAAWYATGLAIAVIEGLGRLRSRLAQWRSSGAP